MRSLLPAVRRTYSAVKVAIPESLPTKGGSAWRPRRVAPVRDEVPHQPLEVRRGALARHGEEVGLGLGPRDASDGADLGIGQLAAPEGLQCAVPGQGHARHDLGHRGHPEDRVFRGG